MCIFRLLRAAVLLCAIALSSLLGAQQSTSYRGFQNQGQIPDDFMPYSASNDPSATASQVPEKDRKVFAKFALRSGYSTYNHLVDGYVLYGTPLNQYIDQVADRLLITDPVLRKKIRFYITDRSEVNAYTFSNGVICINIGLVANLKSEAQLAFILSHEIAHYLKGHSFKAYSHYQSIDKRTKKIFNEDGLKGTLYFTSFSREQEIEADEEGFRIFKNSGYRLSEAVTVFDVLARAEHPFDSAVIRREFLNSAYLKIPDKYYIDTAVATIRLDTLTNDSLRTHPAIPKRKAGLEKEMGAAPAGAYSLVSEQQFISLREMCRYELCQIYMAEHEYQKSIYAVYLLLRDHPEDEYLYSCLVKNLYYIQLDVSRGHKSDVLKNKKKVTGEISRINWMLYNMRADELHAWCLRKAWDIHKKFPDNTEIFTFTKQITKFFKREVSQELSYFYPAHQYNDSLIQTFYATTLSEEVEMKQKNNRGKKLNRVKHATRSTYAKYSMPDYLSDQEFTLTFEAISADKDQEEEGEAEGAQNRPARKRRADRKPKEYDISSIVLADLTDIKMDERKKGDPVVYTALRQHTTNLISNIVKCAELNNLEVNMLVAEHLDKMDSVGSSDRVFIKKFLDERMQYEDIKEYYATDYARLQEIAQRNHTPYVGFIYNAGMVRKKDHGFLAMEALVILLSYPPLILYTVFSAFQPVQESYLAFALYDVTTGKEVYATYQYYNTNSHQDLIKAELYNIFFKVKNQ